MRVKNCVDSGVVKFVLGSIVKRLGPLRYLVRVSHRTRYCHVDHLRSTGETTAETSDEESTTPIPPGHDKDEVTATPRRAAPLRAAMPTPTREKANQIAHSIILHKFTAHLVPPIRSNVIFVYIIIHLAIVFVCVGPNLSFFRFDDFPISVLTSVSSTDGQRWRNQ